MKLNQICRRFVTGLLVAAFAVATVVPAAQAKDRKYKRSKHGYERVSVRSGYGHRRVVVRERSSAGPAIAGFVGGLVLGTAIGRSSAHADYDRDDYARAPVVERHYYYDPYCEHRYASLDACRDHFRYSDHPHVIQVIDVSSNTCVDTYRYHKGRWHDRYAGDNDWRDRDRKGRWNGRDDDCDDGRDRERRRYHEDD